MIHVFRVLSVHFSHEQVEQTNFLFVFGVSEINFAFFEWSSYATVFTCGKIAVWPPFNSVITRAARTPYVIQCHVSIIISSKLISSIVGSFGTQCLSAVGKLIFPCLSSGQVHEQALHIAVKEPFSPRLIKKPLLPHTHSKSSICVMVPPLNQEYWFCVVLL